MVVSAPPSGAFFLGYKPFLLEIYGITVSYWDLGYNELSTFLVQNNKPYYNLLSNSAKIPSELLNKSAEM
jgi:hypothetical protein